MDRRRYVPSAETLDARLLMAADPATSIQQRAVRIDRLPGYLDLIQPGRVVPTDIIAGIQEDLRELVGRLKPASSGTLTAAIKQFRATISRASVSAENAAGLRRTFSDVLETAGAPSEVITDLASDMDRLVKVDSFGEEPAQVAANDYAFILQMALGVGRPIRTPAAPGLSQADDGAKRDRSTTATRPRIVGSYEPTTTIQLLDDAGRVLGSTEVRGNGQYQVQPTLPLAVGKHKLRVRALDANGAVSAPSAPLKLTILAPKGTASGAPSGVPRGPLSL